MSNERENIVVDKSFQFAIRIVNAYKYLTKEKKEFILSKQLLRSGTSIGANIEEAVGGYSKKDFSAKMSISYKECRETIYWLKLLRETEYVETKLAESLIQDASELAKILYSIIRSSKT